LKIDSKVHELISGNQILFGLQKCMNLTGKKASWILKIDSKVHELISGNQLWFGLQKYMIFTGKTSKLNFENRLKSLQIN